jgi:hypothetical protein
MPNIQKILWFLIQSQNFFVFKIIKRSIKISLLYLSSNNFLQKLSLLWGIRNSFLARNKIQLKNTFRIWAEWWLDNLWNFLWAILFFLFASLEEHERLRKETTNWNFNNQYPYSRIINTAKPIFTKNYQWIWKWWGVKI